jgi:predicted ribosome quality control (RQC) complex YloA/Tae2 family protein
MNNYYTIKLLLKEIESKLECSRFQTAYSFVKNAIVLCFYDSSREYNLFVSSEKNLISCYLLNDIKEPRGNAAYFFSNLKHSEVITLEQIEGERALRFSFPDDFELIITLFGSSSNVFLLKENIIVQSFKSEKKWLGKTLKDIFPKMSQNTIQKKDIRSQILQIAPKLPRNFIQELIHYQQANLLSESLIKSEVERWVQHLEVNPSPRLLDDYRFTLFPESILPIPSKMEFSSVNEAIRRSWAIILNETRLGSEKQEWLNRLQQRIRYLDGLVEQATQTHIQKEQSELWQNYGHLLMAQPNQRLKVKEIRTQDFFSEKGEISIPLKEDFTLTENANRYYERSSNAKKSIQILEQQGEEAKNQLLIYKPVLTDLLNCDRYALFLEWKKKWKNQLESFNLQGSVQTETDGFTAFEMNGYEIWLGRNAKSNDIVLQKSHKDDIWLHARGVSGSHTIIRMRKNRENPPIDILEKAASIAAWHSQAKGQSLAPVQFTRRKFLRKPKGAAAGLVKVDKEEVLMVKPLRNGIE